MRESRRAAGPSSSRKVPQDQDSSGVHRDGQTDGRTAAAARPWPESRILTIRVECREVYSTLTLQTGRPAVDDASLADVREYRSPYRDAVRTTEQYRLNKYNHHIIREFP